MAYYLLPFLFLVFVSLQCCHICHSSVETNFNLPIGHLKPLGEHRPPSTNLVDDLLEIPGPKEFWSKYVKPSRAVVLRGAIKHSRAFKEWTDEYLKENFGDLEVRLEAKKEKSGKVPGGARGVGRDTVGNFVSNMHNADAKAYIVSELPMPMWKDVTVIPPLTCGTWKDRLVEVDLWMSGGNTHSILHKDAFNAINCLINGTKKWKMIEYKYEENIYKAWEPPQMVGGFSRINVTSVDLLKYPLVSEVPWSYLTINAGDCLFLPKSYYHQVSSSGDSNIAVALLFARLDDMEELDFSDCNRPLKYTPLSDMELDWQYPGYGTLTMGLTHVESVRQAIRLLFDGEKVLDKEALKKKSRKTFPKPTKSEEYYRNSIQSSWQKIFKHLGGNQKGYITIEDLDKLTREQMRKIVLEFEGSDISNTVNYEYGYIHFNEIKAILKRQLKIKGYIERTQFIHEYKKLGGTQKFATELFDKLGGKDKDRVTQEEYKKNLIRALQPYINNAAADEDEKAPPGSGGQDAYGEDYEEEEEEEEDDDDDNESEQVQQKTGNKEIISHGEL